MEFITKDFIEQSVYRFKLNLPRIEKCLEELNEDQLWQKPNRSSNSTGNLILHLCGNITQYIISGLGGRADDRDRDAEFSVDGGLNKAELKERIRTTVTEAVSVIEKLTEDDLSRVRTLQGFELSGVANIIHVVEHFSYHTGQIVFWTKCLKDKDMGFYKGMDLSKKNKT